MTSPAGAGVRRWVEGARPKTLGASVAPVLVGTAAAAHGGDVVPWRAGAALVVALALQVGVNYANDYADGVRGVDRERRGPVRLVASGLASPSAVKAAAAASFTLAAVVGIVLSLAADWRLILVGAACVLAGMLYSAGPRPYASAGLGEAFVLVFFGFVATVGSAYVHLVRVTAVAVLAAVPVGLGAVAILVVNNLRDVDSDAAAGKRTLAVRLGPARTRSLYAACLAGTAIGLVPLAAAAGGWVLVAALAAPTAVPPARAALRPGASPPELVGALVGTARYQLLHAGLLALGLWRA